MSDHMHITKHGYISSEFAFKNTSASILSGDKLALLRLTIFPTSENTRSEGTVVAGIAKYLRAASHKWSADRQGESKLNPIPAQLPAQL